MRILTGNIKAFIATYTDRRELVDQDSETVLRQLIFTSQNMEGYAYVGEVQVRVDLIEDKEILGNLVDALKDEQKAIQAHASRRLDDIQNHINRLLSLDFIPAPPLDDDIPF